MKRVIWAEETGAIRPIDMGGARNLVAVPGDGIYLVPREVACVMQRVAQECEVPVEVYAETYARQFCVRDERHRRTARIAFECVADMGVVLAIDWVCSLFSKEVEVVFSMQNVEEPSDVAEAQLDNLGRRIVIRKKERQ